jgi:ribonucleoside-diphosphate reductase alpha chain
VNLWIKTPDLKTLSHMYRQAWHAGLKTTYYLRSLGASNIEKATVAVKKEVRGAIKEGQDGGQNSGDAGGTHSVAQLKAESLPLTAHFDTIPPMPMTAQSSDPSPLNIQPSTSASKPEYSAAEKTACSIEAQKTGGECEACQ